MKIFTAQQMRDFDKTAVEKYGIPSIVLMENAALRVVEFLEAKFSPLSEKRIVILCGKGNNGGDGLAIARHLLNGNDYLEVYVTHPAVLKGDAAINLNIYEADSEQPFNKLETLKVGGERPALILDCLLGTGISGALRDKAVQDILYELKAGSGQNTVVSIDIASGIGSDDGILAEGAWASSDYTVTFAAPKRGFFVRDGLELSGEIWVGDIGTSTFQMSLANTGIETIGLETAQKMLPHRSIDAHKGDAGRVLIVGGSFGMSGSVVMASRAALNVGAGLCIAAVPEKILNAFATAILEPTSHPLPCDENGRLLEKAVEELPELWKNVQVVALGPGIGRSDETFALVRRIVRECPQPLIIDADALHALPAIADEVKNRKSDTVLTPHPGEMAELMGISAKDVNDDRYGIAAQCAQKYGAVVVLKGARSLVATPDGRIFVNLTGNPGMATGGSGDALTGTIAGLLAQLKNAEDATKLGVYLHGYAGDLAFAEKGNGLVAGDIISHLGPALVAIPKREVEKINGRLRKLE